MGVQRGGGATADRFHYGAEGTRVWMDEVGAAYPWLPSRMVRGKTQSAGESLQQNDATLLHGE